MRVRGAHDRDSGDRAHRQLGRFCIARAADMALVLLADTRSGPCGSARDAARFVGPDGDFNAIARAQLLHQARQMRFYGAQTDM